MARALVGTVSGLGLALALAAPVPALDELPASPPATILSEGVVLQRKMAPGETHRYEIVLREGEYAQVMIEQRGVDVAQAVTGPDGATLIDADTPGADYGPDALAFVAPTGGRFTLTVRVAGRMTPEAGYELRVEAVREPTEKDLLRVETVRKAGELSRLNPEREPQRALDLFLECMRAWQQLGEPRLRMWNESYVGHVLAEFMDRQIEGLAYTERSVTSARETGDSFAEAFFLTNLGVASTRLGRFGEARKSLEDALQIHRAAGRRIREAAVLTGLGSLFSTYGDLQRALDRSHEALQLYAQLGDRRNEAVARMNIGPTYVRLGDYEAALEHYRLALPALEKEQRLRARVITQMAVAHLALGDRAAARGSLEEALAIYKALENRALEASTSTTLATLEREEGRLELAEDRLERAIGVFRASGERVMEATAQCELGETRRLLGDSAGARDAFRAGLSLVSEPGSAGAVCAEAGLARVARDQGDLRGARTHVERALASVEALRGSLASVRARASALSRQQTLYELAVEIRMRQHEGEPGAGHDIAALEIAERARARSLLELLSEGGLDIREGVAPDLLAEERSLSAKLNATAEAQEQAVVAKKTERAEALAREVTLLMTRLAELEARLRRVSPRYAALTRPQPLSAGEIQRDVLDEGTLLLEYALGETTSYLWVVSTTAVRSYRLAPKAEIEVAARALYERLSAPPPAAGFEREAATLSRLVLGPAAEALGDKRLVVVAPGMLQYVPFGVLPAPGAPSGTSAPVVLLSRQEVMNAPSASVVAVIRREAGGRPTGRRTAAVLADPVYDRTDPRVRRHAGAAREDRAQTGSAASTPGSALERALRSVRGSSDRSALTRLPFSRQEADSIAALAPHGHVREALGFEASRETALSPELGQYAIVHLAVHGLLDAKRPELSGLVLSLVDEEGKRTDGFLRLHDVYNMKLAADLVVLSGCQTGLGKAVQGEGLVGLTRGFMYAGARAVVASLWQVDDESTAELMKRFYRGMLKENRRPAEALRAAQLEMSRDKRWSAPFYWAGFVLQGEWR